MNFGRDDNTIMIKEDVISLNHPQIMSGNHYHQLTKQMRTITVSDHLERNSDTGELTIECFGSDSMEHELISSNRHTSESRSVSKSFERVKKVAREKSELANELKQVFGESTNEFKKNNIQLESLKENYKEKKEN